MDVGAYLARLGYQGAVRPSLEVLRELHLAHLRTIPFENLSIHLGEPIVLDPHLLVTKVVDLHRGGFCYELNGAFRTLLVALGFRVDYLAARVYDGDLLGPPFDHLTLRVWLDEPLLADVGFGRSFLQPLSLQDRSPQLDPAGRFLIAEAPDGELDLLREDGSDWVPQYRFGSYARDLAEFADACTYHQTSPESHFTRGSVCSIATESGRVTIQGSRLIVSTSTGPVERELGEEELRSAYRDHFGIVLGVPPRR